MSYKSEGLIAKLRAAREAQGLSQRALAAKSGLTQSHISHIERGALEPGLSSIIDLVRALDLELVLVPKQRLPAVAAIARDAAANRVGGNARRIKNPADIYYRANRAIAEIEKRSGQSTALERIAKDLWALRHMALSDDDLSSLRDTANMLVHHKESSPIDSLLNRVAQRLHRMRTRIERPEAPTTVSAYALTWDDDEDDDA